MSRTYLRPGVRQFKKFVMIGTLSALSSFSLPAFATRTCDLNQEFSLINIAKWQVKAGFAPVRCEPDRTNYLKEDEGQPICETSLVYFTPGPKGALDGGTLRNLRAIKPRYFLGLYFVEPPTQRPPRLHALITLRKIINVMLCAADTTKVMPTPETFLTESFKVSVQLLPLFSSQQELNSTLMSKIPEVNEPQGAEQISMYSPVNPNNPTDVFVRRLEFLTDDAAFSNPIEVSAVEENLIAEWLGKRLRQDDVDNKITIHELITVK